MVLPTIGVFHVKDGMSAVAFDEGLGKDVFKIFIFHELFECR